MFKEILGYLDDIKEYYGGWMNLLIDSFLKYTIVLFFLIFVNFSDSLHGMFSLLLMISGVLLYISFKSEMDEENEDFDEILN